MNYAEEKAAKRLEKAQKNREAYTKEFNETKAEAIRICQELIKEIKAEELTHAWASVDDLKYTKSELQMLLDRYQGTGEFAE